MRKVLIWLLIFWLGFGSGLRLGKANSKIIEVEKEVEVHYLDLTAPDLRHRLEVCANTLGLTISDKLEIEKAKFDSWRQEYEKGYRERK